MDHHGELKELKHEPMEPFPFYFRLVFGLCSLYLVVVLWLSWGAEMGGHH